MIQRQNELKREQTKEGTNKRRNDPKMERSKDGTNKRQNESKMERIKDKGGEPKTNGLNQRGKTTTKLETDNATPIDMNIV